MTGIDLSTDAPPDPERTLQLAGTLAGIVRTLNHATRHHEALGYPSEADRVIREVALMASRLPQLLEQVGSWLAAEREAGRIEVTSGRYRGDPAGAVRAARLRLDAARLQAEELHGALEYAGHVLAELGGAAEDGTDG